MMTIEHVLAVVPVSGLERADAWYEALFGRPSDNRPMPSLVEWQVTAPAGCRSPVDTDRAGSGLLNLAVDDLTATREELATRGLDTAEIQPVNKGVELSATSDPDGNTITLIGNFPCDVLGRSSHSQPAAATSARSCSPALLLIAPGETPMTRLKARLNAASDR